MKNVGLLVIIVVATFVYAQAPDTLWTKTYGASGEDWSWSVRETADSGYIIVGSSSSFTSYGYDMYLIKTDVNGDTIWTRTYGGENTDRGYSVEQTSDGGYIIAGYTRSFGAGGDDVYLVKTDGNGDTLWTKTYGGSSDEEARSARQTDDGGYIVTGCTESFGAGGTDVYLIKTDSLGDSLWTKTYGDWYNDLGLCVEQTTDGGYIVAGQLATMIAGLQVYLIKTDIEGNTIWAREYGYPDFSECGYAVQETSDNGFIVVGEGGDSADYDIYLVKTDSSGLTQWDRWIGGNDWDHGYDVQQTNDGGYIIVGMTFSFGPSWGNVYLVRTNGYGYVIWEVTYGGNRGDYGRSVRKTWDNGYIVAGHTYSFGAGSRDVYLIKLAPDTLGIIEDQHTNYVVQPYLRTFPNPFSSSNTIQYALPSDSDVKIDVLDVSGQVVTSLHNNVMKPGHHTASWDGCDNSGKQLPSGVYFLKLEAGDYSATEKLLLIR